MEVEYNLEGDTARLDSGRGGLSSSSSFSSSYDSRRSDSVWFYRYLPKCMQFPNSQSPLDATGCATDMYTRSTVFMASIFLGPALLELATAQAEKEGNENHCDNNNSIGEDCEARIYGFKPSSLLANVAIVGGLVSTIILPIFGAIIDHTYFRRQVGAITAVNLTIIKLIETIFLNKHWFVVANLQILSLVNFQLHCVAVYAYSAELSNHPTKQSQYQTYFFTSMFVSMFLYMLEVLIPGTIKGWDDVTTASWACCVTTITCVPLFTLTWRYLFRECPPIRQIPEGESLLTAGFTKLLRTHRHISQNAPHVSIFMKTMAFSEAANAALATIATTYMKAFLDMDSIEIGVAMLIVLIAGLPGSWIGHYFTHKYNNPVTSTKLCLVVYVVSTIAASLTLVPQYQNLIYFYVALFGICQGWIHPQHTVIFVTITTTNHSNGVLDTDNEQEQGVVELEAIPAEDSNPEKTQEQNRHENSSTALAPKSPTSQLLQPQPQQLPTNNGHRQGIAELMGVFLFACQILSFLPPLIFTFLNELGISMQVGMASLAIYFVIGYWGLIQMGDYQMYLQSAPLHQRQGMQHTQNFKKSDKTDEGDNLGRRGVGTGIMA